MTLQSAGWVALLAGLACGRATSDFPRNVTPTAPAGAPSRFIYVYSDISSDSVSQLKCRTPLHDPRDSTKLVLARSYKGQLGDYEVIPPKYRVGPQDYLRLDCGSGQIIGIVPR